MALKTDNRAEVFLVLRCQSGDTAAFDELLRSVQTTLFRYISNIAGQPDWAEDILQDVFLIIYRKIGWLNDPKFFRPWAYRIASRETFRALKKRSRRAEVFEDEILADFPATHGEPEFDDEMIDRLPALLGKLSPASRAVIALHYLNEFTISETADILGVSPGTVKSRLAYGLTVLRKHFGVTR